MNNNIILGNTLIVDGKEMSLTEAADYYELDWEERGYENNLEGEEDAN